MTVCNDCGKCCNPVMLPVSKIEVMTDYLMDPDDRRWILEDLTPISRREARELAPYHFGHTTPMVDAAGELAFMSFYRCRHYDPESRRCTDYENRPGICRRFPWADGVPNPTANLAPECAFNADVGRPVKFLGVK